MQYVKTSLGKQYFVSYYGSMGNMLFIHFPGQSIRTIVDVFSNPMETSILVFVGDEEYTYNGYMWLTDIHLDGNGEVCITLVNSEL